MTAVVVGVDGSVHSVAAAHWGAAEAARRGTGLLLVAGCYHVGRMPESGEEYAESEARARAMLASVAAEESDRFPEVEVRFETVAEWPVGALLAAQDDAELLVVGSRGLGGFRGLMLGSTSRAVAGEAIRPVVVVRPEGLASGHLHAAAEPEEPPPVVVGVDTRDPEPAAVLEFALRAAEDRGAALHAVAVAAWPPAWLPVRHGPGEKRRIELADREEEALFHALESARLGDKGGILRLVRVGHPAALLVEEAQDAALLVLGRRSLTGGSAGPGPDGLGSTAHAVLHHALRPVAVVPHG
ncbi:universal stress protein [Streptacidiphilus neutrinimicus]|uniref:universal stress protein n=1 Tax=Streptacidiphilus neutrinimicus TaxID=105420 RepID=UPI0005A6D6B3|nr:universal stress protein [Streptacidiphilus neutrinimicus]